MQTLALKTPIAQTDLGRTNLLLSGLSQDTFQRLDAHLEHYVMERGARLIEPGTPPDYVYFVESGLVALRSDTMDVATIGYEGVVGVFLASGVDQSPYDYVVHLSGSARRIARADFEDLIATCPDLRRAMLLYAQVLAVQIAEHSVCNANRSLQARVARWLLMCHDRIGSKDIDITHACLSTALSVRRAGVTDALHVLEGLHAIRSKRGLIVVRDRERLQEAAQGAYGVAEAEYERLLGTTFCERATPAQPVHASVAA